MVGSFYDKDRFSDRDIKLLDALRGKHEREVEFQKNISGNGTPDHPGLSIFSRAQKAKQLGEAIKARIFTVGDYNTLKKAAAGTNLDAHHVGQKAVMKKLVPDYNPNTAPAILVPRFGHTRETGVVSRSTAGFTNARQVVARDIMELRRVYPDISNTELRQLIHLNRTMYPKSFFKPPR